MPVVNMHWFFVYKYSCILDLCMTYATKLPVEAAAGPASILCNYGSPISEASLKLTHTTKQPKLQYCYNSICKSVTSVLPLITQMHHLHPGWPWHEVFLFYYCCYRKWNLNPALGNKNFIIFYQYHFLLDNLRQFA